jgi:insertion element IS1 protein InsB
MRAAWWLASIIRKAQTVPAERTHSRLRHWLARFRRRTFVVSRSTAMVHRSIALFAHLHVNGGASKEDIQLRIAA